jgi:hypothetical protein
MECSGECGGGATATTNGLSSLLDELDGDDALHGAGRGVVDLHGEQARLLKAAESAVRLGVESRSQLLAEQLAAGVAALVRQLIAELDLTVEQREGAHQIASCGPRGLVPAVIQGRTTS